VRTFALDPLESEKAEAGGYSRAQRADLKALQDALGCNACSVASSHARVHRGTSKSPTCRDRGSAGATVERALPALGYTNVAQVHIERRFELVVDAANARRGPRPSERNVRTAACQPGHRGL